MARLSAKRERTLDNNFRNITHFIWHFKYDLGPSMQGKLVEIIGPMRSGKNNFAVYLARALMPSKIHVVTSFPMFFTGTQDGPLKDFYQEAPATVMRYSSSSFTSRLRVVRQWLGHIETSSTRTHENADRAQIYQKNTDLLERYYMRARESKEFASPAGTSICTRGGGFAVKF